MPFVCKSNDFNVHNMGIGVHEYLLQVKGDFVLLSIGEF